jgi:hypothetical protein
LREEHGLFQVTFTGSAAFGLQAVQFGGVVFEVALDALFVEGEQGNLARVVQEGLGLAACGIERVVGCARPEGEYVLFYRSRAVETPVIVGDGNCEGAFRVGFRLQAFDGLSDEGFVLSAVFVGA